MTAELARMIQDITILQTPSSRRAFLESLSPAALCLLKAHFKTYRAH